jgi:hypothetical protein
VINRVGKENRNVIAENLVQQPLKVVTKEKALGMIQHR